MKETDLYLPLKRFLESQGYEVKGEVQSCDVLAVRGEEAPVVVELKLSLTLTVVLQAVDRLALSPTVYVGVPRPCSSLKGRQKKRRILKLLRMLGVGLLQIDPRARKNGVEVLLDPGEYRPRKSKVRRERLLGEFARRVGDPNLGGAASRKGVVTAYRQRAVKIARYLHENGATKASDLAKALEDPKARLLVYHNHYEWFERSSRGVYELSTKGLREVAKWQAPAE